MREIVTLETNYMKVNCHQLTQRLATLEANVLDPVLFAVTDDSQEAMLRKKALGVAGTSAAVLGTGAAAVGAHKVISNRMGGMRATVSGFTRKSRLGQYGAAARDLGGDALARAGGLFGAAREGARKGLSKLRLDSQTATLTSRLVALGARLDTQVELGLKEKAKEAGGKIASAAKKAATHVGEHREAYAAGAAATAGVGATGLMIHHVGKKHKKMSEWRAGAKDGDMAEVAPDLLVDRHGAMYPGNHPKALKANITKL